MKAILYCRVSTKEQAEHGYSLEGQEKECRKFAETNGFAVDRIFIERGESAKTQNRTELQKLIKYSIENKKKLTTLIIWKYDRLARNLSDQMELVKNFAGLGIRVLSVTENNEDTSVGKLMRNIIGSFSQYENDIKAERTINGIKRCLEQGRWPWKGPAGYQNTKDKENKSLLVETEEAIYVIEGFQMIESRLYKQTEVAAVLKKKGFKKATKGFINRMLRNPLYAGIIRHQWLVEDVQAIHKPLISKEIFFKVQAILDGKRPSFKPKRRNHPDFPLRNFMKCPTCGQKLTGGWSTGRRKTKYAYYHCHTKGCSFSIRKRDLEAAFYKHLESLQPREEIFNLFEAMVMDVWKTRQAEQIKEEHRLEKELKDLKEKKDRIDELIIKGVFDEETYRSQSQTLKAELLAKQVELGDARIELNDIEACLNYCRLFMTNLATLWANSELNLKQRFQQLVFPQGISFDRMTFRTTAISPIFKEIQAVDSEKSQLASPRGFEPLLLE